MHFVTGGAFNGKRKWVKHTYPKQLDWRSMYVDESKIISWEKASSECSIVVLEGVEQYIKKRWIDQEQVFSREQWRKFIDTWLNWEKEGERSVIWIGTDMMKGIVPIDPNERKWRDYTGWAFQELAHYCDRVSLIWYGIEQRLK